MSTYSPHPPRSLARLVEIVWQATVPLRDKPAITERVEGALRVEEVMDFPTVADGRAEVGVHETIDMTLFIVGILPEADGLKAEFLEALRAYPDQERLVGGPSYIEIGYNLANYDDQAQQVAIQMMALGEYYGYWKVITPTRLGIEEGGASQMARSGFLMISSVSLPYPGQTLT